MKEYTLKIAEYEYNELSEQAKEHAYQNWKEFQENSGYPDPCEDEITNTLQEFCRIFDINCYDWQYDEYGHRFTFKVLNETLKDEPNIRGIRLAKYIWNNYSQYILQPKTYYGGNWKKRKSHIFHTMEDCPLTGVCYDTAVLDPIIKCLTYKELYPSYRELIRECLNAFFKMAQDEQAYRLSKEYFEELMNCTEDTYNEDGNEFRLQDCATITNTTQF